MCGLFQFRCQCVSASEATATAAIATSIATTVATTTTMAATAAGQAVDAGAGRVGLAAGANGLAVRQVQTRKLRGFQWIDVARQLVAIVASPVLTTGVFATAIAALRAATWTTTFGPRTARCGTALAIAAVVKTGIAPLLLATTATFTVATFAAAVALTFKARGALWALRPISAGWRRTVARWTCCAFTACLTWALTATATATANGHFVVTNALHHVAACGLGGCGHHITARRLACAAPQGLATHGNGLGHFARVRANTFKQLDWNLLLGEALDVHHEAFFI